MLADILNTLITNYPTHPLAVALILAVIIANAALALYVLARTTRLAYRGYRHLRHKQLARAFYRQCRADYASE